jgi:acyl-CoA synthetase (AMP-forming)/AMP-acid ligase II
MAETFWDLIARTGRENPEHVVLADDHGRSLTTAALARAGEQVAAGLHELGVGPGDVVSWQLPTVLEAPVLMVACARLGVVQNPIIPLLRNREVGHIARQLGTALLVVPDTWRGFAHADMGAELGLRVWSTDYEGPIAEGWRLPTGDPSSLPDPPTDADAFRWAYYSSGTTADPKGARHSDATVTSAARGTEQALQLTPADVYPIAWPITHIGGVTMLTSMLRTGSRLALFDAWNPGETPERMAAHGPTILGSATPFFRAFLDAEARHGGGLFPDVRIATGGGAPVPVEVNRELVEAFGVPGVACSYGLTEFPIATAEVVGDPWLGTTVGRPGPGVEVRLVDGEVRLKGPQMCLGYVDPALDADGFDEDGWFRSGDLGTIDEHGVVRITGRAKDVIIRNAENISAQEIEELVLAHPDVVDVAVVGVPDPRSGERVCACLVLREGAEVDVTALGAYCTERGLARHKCPEQLMVVDDIPRNPMGKILKSVLQERASAAGP